MDACPLRARPESVSAKPDQTLVAKPWCPECVVHDRRYLPNSRFIRTPLVWTCTSMVFHLPCVLQLRGLPVPIARADCLLQRDLDPRVIDPPDYRTFRGWHDLRQLRQRHRDTAYAVVNHPPLLPPTTPTHHIFSHLCSPLTPLPSVSFCYFCQLKN